MQNKKIDINEQSNQAIISDAPIRVLYVYDYQLYWQLVKDAFEKEHGGFQTIGASFRKEYELMLPQVEFDIVLSDYDFVKYVIKSPPSHTTSLSDSGRY